MSDDLISRKALMEGRVENDPVRIAAMCAPTAFNKEKVIGELRNVSLKFRIAGNFNSSAVADRAIEIVEKGGLN